MFVGDELMLRRSPVPLEKARTREKRYYDDDDDLLFSSASVAQQRVRRAGSETTVPTSECGRRGVSTFRTGVAPRNSQENIIIFLPVRHVVLTTHRLDSSSGVWFGRHVVWLSVVLSGVVRHELRRTGMNRRDWVRKNRAPCG